MHYKQIQQKTVFQLHIFNASYDGEIQYTRDHRHRWQSNQIQREYNR